MPSTAGIMPSGPDRPISTLNGHSGQRRWTVGPQNADVRTFANDHLTPVRRAFALFESIHCRRQLVQLPARALAPATLPSRAGHAKLNRNIKRLGGIVMTSHSPGGHDHDREHNTIPDDTALRVKAIEIAAGREGSRRSCGVGCNRRILRTQGGAAERRARRGAGLGRPSLKSQTSGGRHRRHRGAWLFRPPG